MNSLPLLLLLFPSLAPQEFPKSDPPGIIAAYASIPPVVDGRLMDEAWISARWSDRFVDITGDPSLRPTRETRAAFAWDSTFLYVAVFLEEQHVWGTLRQRDTVIYHDNDIEFFFDPDGDRHRYGEVEVNALNTVWDLYLEKPYRNGGPAVSSWNIEGLETAVDVRGTVNDPRDVDTAWTFEMKIPWRSVAWMSRASLPPADRTQWRVNLSRVQWPTTVDGAGYRKSSKEPMNWVWAPQGVVDMHLPERWGVLEFRMHAGKTDDRPSDPYETIRRALMKAYLGLSDESSIVVERDEGNGEDYLTHRFMDGNRYVISKDGRLRFEKRR